MLGILVEAGRHAERRGEAEAQRVDPDQLVVRVGQRSQSRARARAARERVERLEREVVGALGVDPAQDQVEQRP